MEFVLCAYTGQWWIHGLICGGHEGATVKKVKIGYTMGKIEYNIYKSNRD